VLIGAVGFVVSCFLPYGDFDLPGMVTPSFYRLIILTGVRRPSSASADPSTSSQERRSSR